MTMTRRFDTSNDWHKKTPDEQRAILAFAKRLRTEGFSFHEISKRLHVNRDTLRRRLDPGFTDRDRATAKKARDRDNNGLRNQSTVRVRLSEDVRRDAAARLREIQEDTRSLTGRLLGDPIPARSALGRAASSH